MASYHLKDSFRQRLHIAYSRLTPTVQVRQGFENTIAVTNSVYPVYVDTNLMAGNTGDANRIF